MKRVKILIRDIAATIVKNMIGNAVAALDLKLRSPQLSLCRRNNLPD